MSDPRLPQVLPSQRVLDIGCGTGEELSQLSGERYGLDIDPSEIAKGKAKYPELTLVVGNAQKLPYPDKYFDVGYSLVSLDYANRRKAFTEFHRVLKPGAVVALTSHDETLQRGWFLIACRNRAWKRVIDHVVYIYPFSWLYILTGISLPRPWNGKYELFSTPRRHRLELLARGFRDIEMVRTVKDWMIRARA